jgi:hypothetical protein
MTTEKHDLKKEDTIIFSGGKYYRYTPEQIAKGGTLLPAGSTGVSAAQDLRERGALVAKVKDDAQPFGELTTLVNLDAIVSAVNPPPKKT